MLDRLPEAVAGRVEPRGAERPAADPDGGARALLRATIQEATIQKQKIQKKYQLSREMRAFLNL